MGSYRQMMLNLFDDDNKGHVTVKDILSKNYWVFILLFILAFSVYFDGWKQGLYNFLSSLLLVIFLFSIAFLLWYGGKKILNLKVIKKMEEIKMNKKLIIGTLAVAIVAGIIIYAVGTGVYVDVSVKIIASFIAAVVMGGLFYLTNGEKR